MCFCLPFCCFKVTVIGTSQQLLALSSFSSPLCASPLPTFTQFALKSLFLCCSGSLIICSSPVPSLQNTTHPQAVQADNLIWILPWLCQQSGIWLPSTPERRSIISHSRLEHTIKAQVQNQTLDGQMLSQDLLLLTPCSDYYMMATGLCKLLLAGTRSSPAFNAMCLQLSHLHRGDVLPPLYSCQVDFDPLSEPRCCPGEASKRKNREVCLDNRSFDYAQITNEPFESPQNLQRCEENTLGTSTTSNSSVQVNFPHGS